MAVNPEKVRSSPVNTHATVITEPGNEQRLLQAETLLARTLEIEPWHLVLLKAKAAVGLSTRYLKRASVGRRGLIREKGREHSGLTTKYRKKLSACRFHRARFDVTVERFPDPRD